jgi:hypothetical protein
MKRIILSTVCLLALSLPVSAKTTLSYERDFETSQDTWGVAFEKQIGAVGDFKLSGGGVVDTLLSGYTPKEFLISGVPSRQDYTLYLKAEYKGLTVRLTDWCNHYLAQSPFRGDTQGVTIRVEYTL